ncbi:hypothetical protein [Nicoliella lavandulae]|uniref:Uncharacterized protein n=1 Tax=Nicoliella lavandulae TaxID=3082954 RepID=A0ABU8SMA3_9LACO
MFDRLSQPITVDIPYSNSKKRDAHGKPIIDKGQTLELNEPIVNDSNPNLTFTNQPGGQQPQATMYWESKAVKNAPKGTVIKTADLGSFETVSSGQVVTADIVYYQLKRVGDAND